MSSHLFVDKFINNVLIVVSKSKCAAKRMHVGGKKIDGKFNAPSNLQSAGQE